MITQIVVMFSIKACVLKRETEIKSKEAPPKKIINQRILFIPTTMSLEHKNPCVDLALVIEAPKYMTAHQWSICK